MLRWLRKLIKPSWRRPYHLALAWIAALRYGQPSRKLIVIGVTGTDGKTTTATMLAAALAGGGLVGLSSTVWFQVGEKRWLNETHMTMPGRFQLQRLLRRMVDAGCKYAVLEISSEGLAQGRLRGVAVDMAVLTNISPEHIESHGSFEKYRAAKRRLFEAVSGSSKKVINGQTIAKTLVVNGDDKEAEKFINLPADKKIATSVAVTPPLLSDNVEIISAAEIESVTDGSVFRIGHDSYRARLPGIYNVANAVQAIAVARSLGLSADQIRDGLAKVDRVPGRFEQIDAGQGRNVVIDYAVTPAAMRELFTTLRQRGAKHIIAVFGATGGGRDKWKRPELGKIAGELCDHIILTTEDPFDEDPMKITEDIRAGIPAGKENETIIDRREAIKHALAIAQPGDVIALTGMGSETTMNVGGGRRVEWSDKQAVAELCR